MLEKLKQLSEKYEGIKEKISDANIVSDQEKFKNLMKEYKTLTPIIEKYHEYMKIKTDLDDASELLKTTLEKDFKDMVEEEYFKGKENLEIAEQELKILLLPKDPNDERSVIMEIRGGAGGDEASLFAASLFRMYSMYAEYQKYKVEVLSINETELKGIKEIVFAIDGDGAYSKLKFESGVHRVQRVPETESSGRIHTSTVTVAVLPEVDEIDFEINPNDLQIETHRSAGAGGQHVNKTESAIRIIHLPTNTVVDCQDERSQHKNKEKAMKILRSKIYEKREKEKNDKIAGERKLQVGTGDRSERIRTYNFPQGRITDHRIGLTLYKLLQVMDGVMDELIEALITTAQAEKLQSNPDL